MWFFVMFLSPVYFAKRGRWGAFTANAILYLIAIVTLIFGIGVVFWVLAVMHAAWDYRKELQTAFVNEQAAAMAKAMKEKS